MFFFGWNVARRRCYGVVYEQYLQIMVVSFGIWLMEIRAFGGKIALTCHPMVEAQTPFHSMKTCKSHADASHI